MLRFAKYTNTLKVGFTINRRKKPQRVLTFFIFITSCIGTLNSGYVKD